VEKANALINIFTKANEFHTKNITENENSHFDISILNNPNASDLNKYQRLIDCKNNSSSKQLLY